MAPLQVRFCFTPGTVIGRPSYKSEGAAGADLCARLDCPHIVEPGAYAQVPTGVILEIPPGYEGQVRGRSGLAHKRILTHWGTIDSDFRGELAVMLYNVGVASYTINPGDRVGQLVIAPVVRAEFEVVSSLEELTKTERGSDGFGSTGV